MIHPFRKQNIVMRNREALQATAAVITILSVIAPVVTAAAAVVGGLVAGGVNAVRNAAAQQTADRAA